MSSPTQQQSNIPDYLSPLGLDRAPFLDQIDDHFFYADPALVQHLDLLQHLTRFGDMLLGISGPLGSGKTTLLQQFLLRGNTTWRSCLIDGGKIQQPGDLLARLAECFGQDMTATPERIKADVIRFCQGLQHNSQQAVIVIENAHLLPDLALKSLLDLGGDARETLKLVRVLLFSEPDLKQKFIDLGLSSPQRPLLHSLDVPRFDEQQTAAYLMYRLAAAGFSGDSPFSMTEIRAMHKAAEGLPGRLNTLAHETLIERANRLAARKKMKLDPKPVTAGSPSLPRSKTVVALILGGILLALGAAGGYLMQSGNPQDSDRRAAEEQLTLNSEPVPEPAQSIDLVQPEAPKAPTTQADIKRATTEDLTKAGNAEILGSNTNISQQTDNIIKKSESPVPVTGDIAAYSSTKANASPEPEALPESVKAEQVTVEPATEVAAIILADNNPKAEPMAEVPSTSKEEAVNTLPVDTHANPEQQMVVAEKAENPATESAPLPTGGEQSTAASTAAREAAVVVEPASIAVVPKIPDLMGATWLLERPATHFTLQLLGVRNETSLQKYIAQSQIPSPVAYFHTEYKGGDWFVLVQGDYPTKTAAREAISALPAAVRKSKPWPRTFATVHADIQKISP